jgi:hypothetical protein
MRLSLVFRYRYLDDSKYLTIASSTVALSCGASVFTWVNDRHGLSMRSCSTDPRFCWILYSEIPGCIGISGLCTTHWAWCTIGLFSNECRGVSISMWLFCSSSLPRKRRSEKVIERLWPVIKLPASGFRSTQYLTIYCLIEIRCRYPQQSKLVGRKYTATLLTTNK